MTKLFKLLVYLMQQLLSHYNYLALKIYHIIYLFFSTQILRKY
jgi:hypothetical protein